MGGNTFIKLYCNDKDINLTRSKIIIHTKEDLGPHISAQVPGAETKAKVVDANKLEITFGSSTSEISILNTRRTDVSTAVDALKNVKHELDSIDSISFDSPKERDLRVKGLNNSAIELQSRIKRFRRMIKLMSTDLVLKPKTIENLSIYNTELNFSNIESIEIKDANASLTVPVKPEKIKYPEYIKDFNFQKDDVTENSGIAKLLVDAAKNDPALKGKVKASHDKFDIAKQYYNMLFFPTKDTYDIFEDNNQAYPEFLTRKKNCYARGAYTEYSGCDVYYSLENLIDAYKLLLKNYPEIEHLANTDDELLNKRQLAAFFANIAQETNGGSYATKFTGLPYALTTMVETPCNLIPGLCADYGVSAKEDGGNEFYGRGGKQLSYPANYKFYSTALFDGNQYILYRNPDILVHPMTTSVGEYKRPGLYGYASSLAYMALRYNDGCEHGKANCGPNKEHVYYVKPSMLEGLDPNRKDLEIVQEGKPVKIGDKFGESGFGQTINIINGGVECKATVQEQNLNRISGYVEMLLRLNAGIKEMKITTHKGESIIRGATLVKNLVNNPVKFETGNPLFPILNTSPVMGSGVKNLLDYLDQITRIDLVYDNGFEERLDCVGYGNF